MNIVRVMIIGDGCVGKTSLLNMYISHQMNYDYIPTVFDNYGCHLTYKSQSYRLYLYDTNGQEDYEPIRALNYSNIDIILLCFSCVEPNSFLNIKNKWLPELRKYNLLYRAKILLIGTKSDLKLSTPTYISSTSAQQLAVEISAADYIECSSSKNINIDLIFQRMAQLLGETPDRSCYLL